MWKNIQNKRFEMDTQSSYSLEPGSIILIKSLNPDDLGTPPYMNAIARTLNTLEYDVRVISCEEFPGKIPYAFKLIQWMPRSIFGLFKSTCTNSKLLMIASMILYYKKHMKPALVIVEEMSYIIPLLKLIGGLKIMYIENVLRNLPALNNIAYYRKQNRHHQLYYLKYVERIIVSCNISDFLLRTLDGNLQPILLYPNIETREYLEAMEAPLSTTLSLISSESVFYLLFGEYNPETNFQIAIDAFYNILDRYIPIDCKELFLVICGTTHDKSQVDYMNTLMETNKYVPHVIYLRNLKYQFRLGLLYRCKAVLFTDTAYNHDQILMMCSLMLGKIVLATNCDITEEFLIHKNTAYICEPEVECFERYMYKVLRDTYVQNRMSEACTKFFDFYYRATRFKLRLADIMQNMNNPNYGPYHRLRAFFGTASTSDSESDSELQLSSDESTHEGRTSRLDIRNDSDEEYEDLEKGQLDERSNEKGEDISDSHSNSINDGSENQSLGVGNSFDSESELPVDDSAPVGE